MDLGLRERVYIVTGATRGLGRATAEVLVAEGARVVVVGRAEEAVTAAAEEIGPRENVLGVTGDLADSGLESRLVAAAHARWGRLDGALISVGGPPPGTIMSLDDGAWRAAFETVFLGALRMIRAVAAACGHDGASVALVLSTSVRSPIEGLGASNGLRPGLAMTAKALADELGPRGIRVFGLMPGTIATDRIAEIEAASGDAEAARARTEAAIPLRRVGRPEEFGRVAAFALSPAASYLSGTMIPVDGGRLRAL